MSVQTLAARLQYAGGDRLGRINKQKLNSLLSALKNDYQSRPIKTPGHQYMRGLVNTSNLKPDYDKKILSIPFDAGLQAGDVFECLDDGSHWMVYLPQLTETAYLRSEIIRCRYTLDVDGTDYWIYFQGPTETDLRWYIKNGTNDNELNLSGTIYIKNNPQTKAYFKRFTHLKIDGHIWEVQVTDPISVPGILELEVQEYYDNSYIELPIVTDVESDSQIKGQHTVRQDTTYGYAIPEKYMVNPDWEWSIEGNDRVRVVDTYQDGRVCKIKVEGGAIGGFTLCYGSAYEGYKLNIQIDISEPPIVGPEDIYPYDKVEFTARTNGTFWVETELAKIISFTDNSCVIEVVTGKKGSFTLYFRDEEGEEYELPIKIKSF